MSTSSPAAPGGSEQTMTSAEALDAKQDPYVRTPDKIQEPPRTLLGRLKFLGPGMITSAAVVGSGELLTATALGAQAGFMLLWLVLVSTFLKVWVQIELGRWSISTGRVSVNGYDDVPPRLGKRGWMSWLVLLMFVQFLTSQAGVITASAFAFSTLLPIGGDPYSFVSIGSWVAILVAIAIAVHATNRYQVVEKLSTALVFLVTVFAVVTVFAIQGTEFAWTAGDIGDGMRFQIFAGSMGIALSMFGLTGVGAGEITGYPYWAVEKGYAKWAGPNDGTRAWSQRARGWISVMKVDAWVAFVVVTLSTAAFYMLGAAVLNPQGLVPEGNDVMTTIASIFDSAFGTWGSVAFLIGAGLALYKTILANVPSLGRIIVETLGVFGAFDWSDYTTRNRWLRGTMIIVPIVWGLFGTIISQPFALVVIAGILNSIFLIGVAISTIYLSRTQTDPSVKDGKPFTIMLVLSAIAIIGVGVLGLVDQF